MLPWKRILSRAPLVLWAAGAFVLFLLMGGGRGLLPDNTIRARVTVAKSDMRSLETALESYRADTGTYPATRPLAQFAGAAPDLLAAAGGKDLATFEPGRGDALHGLTTPIAYLEAREDWLDPFTGRPRSQGGSPGIPNGGAWPFAYHPSADGKGWILWSPGPDGVYDLLDPEEAYRPGEGFQPALIERTYDPTNGRTSAGDVIRVKR